uniref:Protein kinase domain-containing protein n=1 Tax=Pyramimonas orientalis virus TaxID=455367 RepID=A0A7M3UNS4_POV01|nr:hypothetical protein HWQ62_00218 [Pyramimonas orientalis virus]
MNDTTLIGQGSFGMIFHPAIPTTDEMNPNMVSKVFFQKEHAVNDYNRSLMMTDNKDARKHMILPTKMYSLTRDALLSELENRGDTEAITLIEKHLDELEEHFDITQVIYEEKGESYLSFITNPNGFELKDAVEYMIQMSKSVEYFVQNELIHNDVKPGNVIITDGEAKFIDFGMSSKYSNYAQTAQDYNMTYEYWPMEKKLYADICFLVNPELSDLAYGIPESHWNDKMKNRDIDGISKNIVRQFKRSTLSPIRYQRNLTKVMDSQVVKMKNRDIDGISKNIVRQFKRSTLFPIHYQRILTKVMDSQVVMPTTDETFYKTIKLMIGSCPETDTFTFMNNCVQDLPEEFLCSSIKSKYPDVCPANEEFRMKLSMKTDEHNFEMNKLNEQFKEFYDKIDVYGLGVTLKDTIKEFKAQSDDDTELIHKLEVIANNATHIEPSKRLSPSEMRIQLEDL